MTRNICVTYFEHFPVWLERVDRVMVPIAAIVLPEIEVSNAIAIVIREGAQLLVPYRRKGFLGSFATFAQRGSLYEILESTTCREPSEK